MKSSIRRSTYLAIYRLLDRVSPVPFDCGQMCSAACCTCGKEDESLGMYLLPGEHKVYSKEDTWLSWSYEYAQDMDFPDSWKGKVYFVRCTNPPHCPREKRPMQCRTFPLTPHIDKNGELMLIPNDTELPYYCPLLDNIDELEEDFVQATLTCWKHLIRDPLIYDLVKYDSELRDF